MKIMVIGKFGVEEFGWHIATTCEMMGFSVIKYEIGFQNDNLASPFKKRVETIISLASNSLSRVPQIDYIRSRRLVSSVDKDTDIIIVTHDFLTPKQLDEIKAQSKACIVLWFPDPLSRFERAMFLNAKYDILFFKDPYVVRYLRNDLRKNAYYLPEACNPKVHRPVPLTNQDFSIFRCDIVQAGNINTNRAALFSQLTKYDVKIWGYLPPLWLDITGIDHMLQRRFVAYDDKARAFLGAKILLNNLLPSEIEGINARAFEGAGIGVFQIIPYRSALKDLFDVNKEIVVYEGFDDLIEKIDYYLPREQERIEIGVAANKRAFKEHTYKHRIELIVKTVAGEERGFRYEQ